MPPSNDKASGRLVFLNHVTSGLDRQATTNVTKKYDDLLDFCPRGNKILFLCQACYSGNVIEKAVKSKSIGISMCMCVLCMRV